MSREDVHVKNLRKLGYDSLEKWLEDPDHVYIGRCNRFIAGSFHSKWKNPYPVTKKSGITRSKAVVMYKQYLDNNKELLNSIGELKGKILGCWCRSDQQCHGDVLLDKLQAIYN